MELVIFKVKSNFDLLMGIYMKLRLIRISLNLRVDSFVQVSFRCCGYWLDVSVCMCTFCAHWCPICWFSTSLIFHRVIFALPAAICFYYLGEYVCLRISIIINKAMLISPLPLSITPDTFVSYTTLLSAQTLITHSLHISVCNWWKANIIKPGFRQIMCTHTVHNHMHINSHTMCCGLCLDWVCAPLLQTVITVSHPVCP